MPACGEMPGAPALLFRPGPALGADARRIALALLEDAAHRRGGRTAPLPGGGLRLEGPPATLDGARDLLAGILRGRDASLVEETAAAGAVVPPADTPEDRLAALPLPSLLRRDTVLGFGPDGAVIPLATRVMPDTASLVVALGPRRAGEPWLSHARDLVAARCVQAPPPGPLHLLVPEGPLPDLLDDTLPLLTPRALARPPARPFGIVGLAPEALGLIGALPPGAVAIYLVPPVPEAAWAALGRGRIILDGPADPARAAALGALGMVAA